MSDKGQELIEKLKSAGLTPEVVSRWQEEYFYREKESRPYNQKDLDNLEECGSSGDLSLEVLEQIGEIKMEDSGGTYHDGSTFWKVFRFEKFGVSLGCQATYSSWDSSYFTNKWKEVTPKSVVISKWFDEEGNDLDTEL